MCLVPPCRSGRRCRRGRWRRGAAAGGWGAMALEFPGAAAPPTLIMTSCTAPSRSFATQRSAAKRCSSSLFVTTCTSRCLRAEAKRAGDGESHSGAARLQPFTLTADTAARRSLDRAGRATTPAAQAALGSESHCSRRSDLPARPPPFPSRTRCCPTRTRQPCRAA